MNVVTGEIRELMQDEKPNRREVSWVEGEAITNLDELHIALAVIKRMYRALKRSHSRPVYHTELHTRRAQILQRVEEYHAKISTAPATNTST